jgi:hypothetical protein
MAICSCGLPARCCQPAVAGGIVYADLWGELSTHLAPQALFTQSSVSKPLLQAFPFPSTLGEVTLYPLSQACVFVYSSHGRWVFPSPVEFSSLCHSHSFPAPGCSTPLLPPSPARPSLFIYSSVRDSPPPIFGAQDTPPSLLHVSIVLIAYYSVSLFFPEWGSVCPGSYADLAHGCLWEYRVPLSSPCGPRLPKPSGSRRLEVTWRPSCFLRSM